MPPRLPPSGCWSCGALPTKVDIRLEAVLHPRTAARGGPWMRLRCPSCGAETALEEVPGGDPVLAPLDAAGLEVPVLAALLDGGMESRKKARRWMERWSLGLERLRRERRAAPRDRTPPPPPPPRSSGRSHRRKAPPPPPPPSPPRDPAIPRTPAEARALLGVGTEATGRDVDAAFRKASRKCHPDLVAHLDEDFQRLAHDKFLRLKAAHDLLRGEKGAREGSASSNKRSRSS